MRGWGRLSFVKHEASHWDGAQRGRKRKAALRRQCQFIVDFWYICRQREHEGDPHDSIRSPNVLKHKASPGPWGKSESAEALQENEAGASDGFKVPIFFLAN